MEGQRNCFSRVNSEFCWNRIAFFALLRSLFVYNVCIRFKYLAVMITMLSHLLLTDAQNPMTQCISETTPSKNKPQCFVSRTLKSKELRKFILAKRHLEMGEYISIRVYFHYLKIFRQKKIITCCLLLYHSNIDKSIVTLWQKSVGNEFHFVFSFHGHLL